MDLQYEPLFQKLYLSFLQKLTTVIAPDSDLSAPFHNQHEVDCLFIQRLALFFCAFFRLHLQGLEVPECHQALLTGMAYLVRISEVPEEEVFKICLDYWHLLAQDLYMGDVQYRGSGSGSGPGPLALGGPANASVGASPRKQLYAPVLSRVRVVMISRMAKPEEVLVVEDEAGNIVREQTKDTEVIAQYKTMREALVYLTHLDQDDTESIMLEKLAQQVDGTEWSWNNLNTLCWAIGSISGAMGEEEEKRFLVTVIKDLLGLCEMKRGKDNKAVIASNIMYVVGQYPRFLRAPKHWKFLRTVVTKLFEFMHEKHPGVQDMACDTFLKIAQKCKRKFVTLQANEAAPYIEELVARIGDNTADLEPHQIYVFYEAVGTMLSEKGPQVTLDRVAVQARLMELPNGVWKGVMQQAAVNLQVLLDPATMRELTKILKTNAAVCGAVGPLFVHQLGVIFLDMLNLYATYSAQVATAVATQGQYATRMSNVRAMRGIKKEVLRLLTAFIEKSGEPESTPAYVAQQIMPPMLEPVLTDYRSAAPEARDAEVLTLFAAAVEKLEKHLVPEVPRILDNIFEVTLEMINKNFEDFPEHRLRFFHLLKAVNNHAFEVRLCVPACVTACVRACVRDCVGSFGWVRLVVAGLFIVVCRQLPRPDQLHSITQSINQPPHHHQHQPPDKQTGHPDDPRGAPEAGGGLGGVGAQAHGPEHLRDGPRDPGGPPAAHLAAPRRGARLLPGVPQGPDLGPLRRHDGPPTQVRLPDARHAAPPDLRPDRDGPGHAALVRPGHAAAGTDQPGVHARVRPRAAGHLLPQPHPPHDPGLCRRALRPAARPGRLQDPPARLPHPAQGPCVRACVRACTVSLAGCVG